MSSDETILLIAETCHEANRVVQRALNEPVSPAWTDADLETRGSAVDGVVSALRNGSTPEQSHENWIAYKLEHGWRYGETKSNRDKTHPCLVPYDQLPVEQRMKDGIFTDIVRRFQESGLV